MIGFLRKYHDSLIEELGLFLSFCLSECKIVLCGQVENHYKLNFIINYPKFPYHLVILQEEIERFAIALMEKFEQNRIVVEFTVETVLFEKIENIDPGIKQLKK